MHSGRRPGSCPQQLPAAPPTVHRRDRPDVDDGVLRDDRRSGCCGGDGGPRFRGGSPGGGDAYGTECERAACWPRGRAQSGRRFACRLSRFRRLHAGALVRCFACWPCRLRCRHAAAMARCRAYLGLLRTTPLVHWNDLVDRRAADWPQSRPSSTPCASSWSPSLLPHFVIRREVPCRHQMMQLLAAVRGSTT
eukprot:5930892-Prymnesium_polylepis.1